MLKGVGPVALRLIGANPDLLDEDKADTVRRVTRLAKSLDGPGAWDNAVEAAARQRDRAEATGTRILGFDEPDFPRLLAASKDSPYFLWVRGRLAPQPEQSVAIIGTRKPTHHGTLIAERISEFFAGQAWSVVSGLALGCDAIAHRATVAAGGHTVAVLAHGLQTVAPASHKGLAEEIVDSGGALVSEFAFGVEPIPAQFVRRDKTQAGLARGVVMVQSDVDGGSLHASRAAISYGRWLAVPVPTARDLATDETKVRANVFLTGQDKGAQRSLLHCAYEDLHLLRPLHGKEDYPQLLVPDAILQ
jgi:DNA processing protein